MLFNGCELSQRSTFETRTSRYDRDNRGRATSMIDGSVQLVHDAVLMARDTKRRSAADAARRFEVSLKPRLPKTISGCRIQLRSSLL